MYVMVIILILTGAVAAFSVTALNAVQAVDTASQISRLHMAANAVRAAVVDAEDNGVYRVPAPELGTQGYSTLPSWLGVAGDQRIQYCAYAPYHPVTVPNDTVTQSDGSTYQITTASSPSTSGNLYVVQSDAPPIPDTLAILIAPISSRTQVPPCSSVTWNGVKYVAPGGVVEVIKYENDVTAVGASWYVAPSASGDGSGSDPSNPSTLEAAIDKFNTLAPPFVRVYLEAGSYTLPALGLKIGNAGKATYPTLQFIPLGNVTFDGNVTISHMRAVLDGITLNGNLVVDDSMVDVEGGSTLNPANYIVTNNAKMRIFSGQVNLTNSAIISIDSSILEFWGSSTIDGSAIALGGVPSYVVADNHSRVRILGNLNVVGAMNNAITAWGGSSIEVGAPRSSGSLTFSSAITDTFSSSLDYKSVIGLGGDAEATIYGTGSVTINAPAMAAVNASRGRVKIIGDASLPLLVAIDNNAANEVNYCVILGAGSSLSMDNAQICDSAAPGLRPSLGIYAAPGSSLTGGSANVFARSSNCWDTTSGGPLTYATNGAGGTSAPGAGAPDLHKWFNTSAYTCQ